MAKLNWDVDGTRKFHAGVSHGVVYPKADGEGYDNGAAWNGLTGVTESPSGAEPTDLWADNMKYARLISGEDYGFTIESYMYPPEFEPCDGLGSPVKGVRIGQQKRKAFGFTWQTKVGTDQDPDAGYIIHVVWNATAKPAEKSHETMNDSPDAETFSWECDTVPVNIADLKAAAVAEFDRKADEGRGRPAVRHRQRGGKAAHPGRAARCSKGCCVKTPSQRAVQHLPALLVALPKGRALLRGKIKMNQ